MTTLARIAPSQRLLNRIHVARGFTAYQHYGAVCDLPTAVNQSIQRSTTDTDTPDRQQLGRDDDSSPHTPSLIVAPAVSEQYRADDTLRERDTRRRCRRERLRDCLEIIGRTKSPDAVISRLERAILELRAGNVDPDRLVERNRVSKSVEAYTQYTQNVAALERARDQDLAVHPGQDVEYVVVDDEKASRERVALAHEETDQYDPSYYETQLVRAVESIVSLLGWSRTDIKRELAETREADLTSWSWRRMAEPSPPFFEL